MSPQGTLSRKFSVLYLLVSDRLFHIFTDHRNLVFTFNPSTLSVPLKRQTIDKLHQWSLKLSSFNYTIHHISGSLNVWADMLTCWAAPSLVSPHIPTVSRVSTLPVGLVCPMNSKGLRFPVLDDIVESQSNHIPSVVNEFSVDSKTFVRNGNGLFTFGKVILVPEQDLSLQLRILIVEALWNSLSPCRQSHTFSHNSSIVLEGGE
jgi:hypothetical protein